MTESELLSDKLTCRSQAIGRLARFRVGARLRERMVDAAMNRCYRKEPEGRAATRRHVIEAARDQCESLVALAFWQIFIRIAAASIVNWWIKRQEQQR